MKLIIGGKEIEVADDVISKAVEEKTERLEVTTENIVIRTSEEEASFKENIRNESIAIGSEIGRKNVLKAMEISVDGAHGSDDKTVEALNKWKDGQISTALTDAKIEPSKQIEAMTGDMEKLRSNIETLTKEKETAENNFKTYVKTETIKTTMLGLVPDNVAIPKEDMLLLMANKIKADLTETGQIVAIGADGQPLKNPTTLNPLEIKDVVQNFFDQNPQYLKKAEGGAGGSDSGGSAGGKQTLEQFTEEMKKAGHTVNGETFVAELISRQKEGLIEI